MSIPDPFDDAMDRAVPRAARSPSSHNSQPWGLVWARSPAAREGLAALLGGPVEPSSHYLVLALDRERELRALPSLAVEMTLSCGIYLDSILAELALAGFRAAPRWFATAPGADHPSLAGIPDLWAPLALVELGPAEPRPRDGRRSEGRTTNRGPYRSDAVPEAVLLALARASTPLDSPAGSAGVRVHLVADRERIRQTGEFVREHAHLDFAHGEAWRETYRFIRFGASAIREAQDGMPITQLLGPLSAPGRRAYQLALWPPAMAFLSRVGYARRIVRPFGELVAGSGLLLALSTDRDEPSVRELLAAGGVAIDLWERASAAGLALHPVSVVLQHPEVRLRFQELLGTAGRTVFFARAGYPTVSFPPAPKRRDPWAAVARL
ncbi:MAG: hypothetical protein HY720_11285 [Planctomycetes bacterium]|nr:hypothetical protein [Planctomycetota bacterium]